MGVIHFLRKKLCSRWPRRGARIPGHSSEDM